ncbi:Hypothetical protein SMAX5B_002034 [Scophthalmus maximus]|uniref:Uncharacterized protein n=1 Tax=Scophthalmus maximus TaxID=52904 RepID=A0A2U9CVP3_SCOMX|nr:uncharacterized protein si:dkey-12l12.1 [Scophthalmus maximus]AWP20755.1 Hypothetical protein SMAX5B_002034 [Scophthalmus maximus]
MGFTIWLCVLCLQASLLSHALDCSGATQGELCVSGQTADGQYDDQKQQRALPLTEGLVLFRRRRQLDRRGPTHLSHSSLPGAVSVKGFPNTLIQADRSRRHLAQASSKKKKRISRVGSFSLLSNDKKSTPLQVTRARRQVISEPAKKGKSGRAGAFSVLADPQTEEKNNRAKRSI